MAIMGYVGSALAVLVSLVALVTFALSRRTAAIEEGRHLETVQQLRRDLEGACAKIHQLEQVAHERDVLTGEIKADVRNIMAALARIEDKLDKHILGE